MSKTHPLNLLLLVAALSSSGVYALDSDKDKPVDVDADHLEGGTTQDVSVLTGHVRMTKGSIVGTGDRADIHQKDKSVNRVVLTGAPATLKQDVEGGGTVDAKARTIDYDVIAKHAVLTGNAVVVHPRGEARGERLTYDVETGKMTGDGAGGDGRVHLHMVPQPKDEAGAKPKDEAGKKTKDKDKKAASPEESGAPADQKSS